MNCSISVVSPIGLTRNIISSVAASDPAPGSVWIRMHEVVNTGTGSVFGIRIRVLVLRICHIFSVRDENYLRNSCFCFQTNKHDLS